MRRLISSTLCKLLQRQTYTCLSSKYGIWMLIGGLLLTLISAFQFGEVVLEWSMQKYAITFNAYHDNIAEKSFQNRLCLPMPIDVVYTWVNGSDPRLLSQLEKLKTELEIEQNKTKLLELKNSRAGNLTEAEQGRNALEKALKHKKKTKATGKIKRVSQMSSTECPFANCIPALSIAIEDGLPASFTLSQVRELGPSFKSAKKVYNITLVGSVKERVTVVQFSEEQQVANALQEKVKWNGRRFRTVQAFYTSDLTKNTGVEARTEIMITFIKSKEEIDKTKQLLRRRLGNKLLEIKYHRKKKVAVAYFSDKKTVESILKPSKNITLEGDVKMNPVRIIWTLFSVNKNDDDEYSESELSASRFADNEELRYSLRSVEKHAPWVRKIFIVTNGQIPSWINLDNPRIRIVTHHEIFPNTSHLPTFSSPAIESHIHQIPGLSQKFIYMNDDVMFGDDVWPDDFYTHSKGQKIYLTWPVPNCNEGCPSSWINDKYCDKACNTSECDWDGGDCLNVKPKSRWGYGSWHGQQSSFKLQFCNTGCADTWVGDRYCDAACNVAKCGFDAGDCGVTQFSQLHSVVVTMAMKDVKVPCGVEAMYFNLTNIFGNGKISEGDYSSSSVLRSATIAQRHKTLTLTFRENQTASFLLYVKGFAGRNESNPVEVKFNVSIVKEIHVNSALKNSATTEDTLHYIRTQNSTDYSGPTSRIQTTLYPIRIHSDPLNYWNSGNISYPIPTWQSLHFDKDYYYYEALKVNNETALPQEIKSTLELIEKEFKDGDLTLKGYKRRKTKLLQDFFKTSNHSSPTVSPLAHLKMLTINGVPHAQTTPGTGMSLDPHFQGIKKINKNMDNKGTTAEKKAVDKDLHSRHLLSLVNWSDDYDKDPEMFSTIKKDEQNAAPDEDAKYVADWIADTKKKLLNYDKDIKEGRRDWEDRYGDWRPEIHPGETSFLPWERTGEFLEYQESEKRRAKVAKYETSPLHSRKLMDTFADSLLHVHRIYNRKFGYTARKVPAHMPHMIDLKVMNELQTILPHEFDQTSSHRLRSPDDMQFAFSFMYFVIGQKKELNITQVLSEVDTDHSGTLSDRELRILATRIFPLPLSLDTLKAFERMLINCSLNQSYSKNHPSVFPTEKYYISDMPLITKDFLASCDPVIALLNDSIKTLTKYKYETLGDEDVAFKMIRDNATAVMLQLDNIRGKRKKFVCLNDNIDHGTKEADVIKALLVDFYETLFPIPSQFELGHNYKNRFLYVDDLNDYLKERALVQKWTNIFMAVCVVIVVIFMFSNKILSILKKLCPFGRRFGPGSARLMTV